ncbi:MAG: acyloxyacyl hydrolase [Terracidiphilus sp.]
MPTNTPQGVFRGAVLWLAVMLALSFLFPAAQAQSGGQKRDYSPVNSFGVIAAYSNDSSHILLGGAEQRKLLEFGGSYNRRLWLGRLVTWQYSAEFLPVALESDPLSLFVDAQTNPTVTTTVVSGDPPISCSVISENYSFSGSNGETVSGTAMLSCHGRRWTMGEAVSPIGMQWNFRPGRKLQPFLDGHGGYMYSTKHIPVDSAGSFNFTFDAGAGLELYRTRTRSLRLEYRYHHISNDNTASGNPGIDNGLIQVTYVFGRR